MWTTLRRLQLRISTFASKKLSYTTVTTTSQQDQSDSEDGLDEDYEIEALDESNEHNFNFQTNTAPSYNGGYSVSFLIHSLHVWKMCANALRQMLPYGSRAKVKAL